MNYLLYFIIMDKDLNFDYTAWLRALHESFVEGINKTIDEFEEGLRQDDMFDNEKLNEGMKAIRRKMLASVTMNIDRLETFYMQNTHMNNEDPNYELIRKIESRSIDDKDYQERVDDIFKEIHESCEEFGKKKQQYLKYCLYDKYLEKEKNCGDNKLNIKEEPETEYFDIKEHEDRIYTKAKQDKEFLKDFKNYIELFENMQTDLLKKIN